jgi:hypothetical protein
MGLTHQPPDAPEAAAIRAVALDLAEGTSQVSTTGGADGAGALRTVAATATVVEKRAKGESTAGESIILALV